VASRICFNTHSGDQPVSEKSAGTEINTLQRKITESRVSAIDHLPYLAYNQKLQNRKITQANYCVCETKICLIKLSN
jgi:hypothetical protein